MQPVLNQLSLILEEKYGMDESILTPLQESTFNVTSNAGREIY